MRFLFYLGHPAHYHNIKHLAALLVEHKHEVKLVARGKDVLFDLIKETPYECVTLPPRAGSNSKWALTKEVLKREYRLFQVSRKFKPHAILGTDIAITHIAKLVRSKSYILNEDDAAEVPHLAHLGFKYATAVFSPHCCNISPYEHKKIGYSGYHELAYLHPNYFTPDHQKIAPLREEQDAYFVLRFSSLNAHHDTGIAGLNKKLILKIIEKLSAHGRVYISAENKLSSNLEKYQLPSDPKDMHHVLAFAKLYIGDSQTMAAEAAVLGTPAIRFNDFVGKLSYLEELEHKYDLTYGFKTDSEQLLLKKIDALIEDRELNQKWKIKREKMLKETVDLTQFWFDYLEALDGDSAASNSALS